MRLINTFAIFFVVGGLTGCANVDTQAQGRTKQLAQRAGLEQAPQGGQGRAGRRPTSEPPKAPPITQVGGGIPGLIITPVDTSRMTVSSAVLPKHWNWGHAKAQPPECRLDSISKVGYPAAFSGKPFNEFWAARSRLINMESKPEVWAQITDLKAAAFASSQLFEAVNRFETIWRSNQDVSSLVKADRSNFYNENIAKYNNNLGGPEAYIRAAQRLSENQEIFDALNQYIRALALAQAEVGAMIKGARSEKNILSKASEYYEVWRMIDAHCKSILVTEDLSVRSNRLEANINNVPQSFPTSAALKILELQQKQGFEKAHDRNVALRISNHFRGLGGTAEPRDVVWAGIRELFVSNEAEIARQIENMPREQFYKFRPHKLGDGRIDTYSKAFYYDAQSFKYVSQAVDRWEVKSKGLAGNNVDSRSVAEKARVNAPPSEDDLTLLATKQVMKDTVDGPGWTGQRTSTNSFSFKFENMAGTITVTTLVDSCVPASNGHRCKFTVLKAVKDKVLFVDRSYGIAPTSVNVLVQWGKDSLVSSELEKFNLGAEYTRSRRGGSSSSDRFDNGRREDLVDIFVNRDQENRQAYYDQPLHKQREPYNPSKIY